MYQHIYCPLRKKKFSINSSYGRQILKNYIHMFVVNSRGGTTNWSSGPNIRNRASNMMNKAGDLYRQGVHNALHSVLGTSNDFEDIAERYFKNLNFIYHTVSDVERLNNWLRLVKKKYIKDYKNITDEFERSIPLKKIAIICYQIERAQLKHYVSGRLPDDINNKILEKAKLIHEKYFDGQPISKEKAGELKSSIAEKIE